jgi:hypothetical protein
LLFPDKPYRVSIVRIPFNFSTLVFRQIYGRTDPFYLYMSEIEEELGTVQGVQVTACFLIDLYILLAVCEDT